MVGAGALAVAATDNFFAASGALGFLLDMLKPLCGR
tara:strand:+ start:390 stop:497 length:108 start_codon:yes stop_codon:yes gene_type:complete